MQIIININQPADRKKVDELVESHLAGLLQLSGFTCTIQVNPYVEPGLSDYKFTDYPSSIAYDYVMDAFQRAEEIGGPEGLQYLHVMSAIANVALERIKACESHNNEQLVNSHDG
jgi:hypothetical protein